MALSTWYITHCLFKIIKNTDIGEEPLNMSQNNTKLVGVSFCCGLQFAVWDTSENSLSAKLKFHPESLKFPWNVIVMSWKTEWDGVVIVRQEMQPMLTTLSLECKMIIAVSRITFLYLCCLEDWTTSCLSQSPVNWRRSGERETSNT